MNLVQAVKGKTKPFSFYLLIVGMITLGLGGIRGGSNLLLDPTGHSLGVPHELLRSLPITNFRLPGVFLTIMFGFTPIFLGYALWARLRWPLAENAVGDCKYHWAWAASVGLCALLLIWTTCLFAILGYRIYYQLLDSLVGLALLNLLLLPAIRRELAQD